MKENIIRHLKDLFLWTSLKNKSLIFEKMRLYVPANVEIVNENLINLDFGTYDSKNIIIPIELIWNNNTLVDIK